MNVLKPSVAGLCLTALAMAATPAAAQTSCAASPEAAVRCFVNNAVKAGLLNLPAGITLAKYRAYGISVSNIVQAPDTLMFVLGTMCAVSDALPATNADGATENQEARDAAIDAIVDAGLNAGLASLPPNTTANQLKQFARDVAAAMTASPGVQIAPGALLRLLDAMVVKATSGDTVDWNKVSADISSTVDGLVTAGLLKLPEGLPVDNVKQFANDLALAIQNYKTATGKTQL